jgi:hypothetical protein
MLQLNEKNWKCANCSRFINLREPCVINGEDIQYPDVRFELTDDCGYFIDENMGFVVDINNAEINVSYTTPKRTYTGTVTRDPDWDENTIKVAIIKAKEKIMLEVATMEDTDNSVDESVPDTDETESNMENVKEDINELIAKLNGLLNTNINTTNDAVEQTLEGETEIAWMERVTDWKRVLNAARRTIGREQSSKEPSDSWKSKILLAEHSPIRLLEYDFGWKKIRQWVTAHLVRHHEGCEKFVHSQRGDRRELPCERDRLPQGARNDMDMTANAQALISISRKRCCMCASKETREAWGQVLNELEKIDPILRSKCVRECVYRGFCPEWMSKCKYCYSPAYWLEVKNYRNTTFGNDENWKTNEDMKILVSSIGRITDLKGNIYEEKADAKGAYVTIDNERYYIRDIMDATYGTAGLDYVDGNKYNNALSNLV